jgi:hypothetical protein
MRYLVATLIAVFCLSGCMEKRQRTVGEFMEDEAALYGTLLRCESAPAAADDPECRNARQAAERLAVIEERAISKAREQAFVTAREEYRTRLDRERALRVKAEAEAEEARLQALLNSQEDVVDSETPAPPAEEQALPDNGGN